MTDPPSDSSYLMYEELAWLFPILSPAEHYEEESERFYRLMRKEADIPVLTMLNLGCGAGCHDVHFERYFEIVGVDLSETMLEVARDTNPQVEYIQGDMRDIRLDRAFDSVAVFDSMVYMTTPEMLRQAFETAFAHLKPGGVLVTAPEEVPETFEQNANWTRTMEGDDVSVTFIEHVYDPDPDDTEYETTYVYLVRRAGEEQKVYTEFHRCGIFPVSTWLRLLEEVGFEAKAVSFEPDAPRTGLPDPILVGKKPLG